jgi:hypothetical protein
LAADSPSFLIEGAFILAGLGLWLLSAPRRKTRPVARLGGLTGKRNQFCRGWLITDDVGADWRPPHRFNLTGDRSIPFTTYAKFVVDTATSLGQGWGKGFSKSQAQTHIAHALEMLFELQRPVTLLGAFELLSDRAVLEEEMENLEGLLETPRRAAVYAHFVNRFPRQETRGEALMGFQRREAERQLLRDGGT